MTNNERLNINKFDYNSAFIRNIGWFTPKEQDILKNKTIAIPGLGGVGGHHLHNFLRTGFQSFHIADFDSFQIHNFNRQLGANCQSIDREKVEVMFELAKSINPNCQIELFNQGVQPENMERFLEKVDLVVDTLDLYAMSVRIALYDLAHQKGIPVITAGPFGMGTTIMAFHPDGPSFSEYFQLKNPQLTTEEKIVRFLAGIIPHLISRHKSYLAHPQSVKLFEKSLPSLNIGCDAASAAMGSVVVKYFLKRGPILWAPRGFFVDFYHNYSGTFYRPFGNRNPWQKLKIYLMKNFFLKTK